MTSRAPHDEVMEPAALVVAFLNSRYGAGVHDETPTVAALRRWLAVHGLPARGVGRAELAGFVALREALRTALRSRRDRSALMQLSAIASGVWIQVAFESLLRPVRRGRGVGARAAILDALLAAHAAGVLGRIKVCKGIGCEEAFLDRSKNGSGVWCSVAVCRNRIEATAPRTAAGTRRGSRRPPR